MLPQNEELIATLQDLGLTRVQARILTALANLEEATVETTAKTAHIARQHLYEPLAVLEKKSLLQKVISNPTKYRALPIQEVCSILMKIRNKENYELQHKVSKLIKNLEKHKTQSATEVKETLLITGVSAFLHKINAATASAQTSFDGTADIELFRHGMVDSGEIHRASVKRGVHYRHIISLPEKRIVKLGDEDLRKNPLWKVRFSFRPLIFQMTIIDKKEVFISLHPHVMRECQYYWSNDICFLTLAQSYYDNLWKQASKSRSRRVSKIANRV